MSDRIRLTKKQIDFVMEHTMELDPEKAVERFADLMIMERVDPTDMVILIDKLIQRMKK